MNQFNYYEILGISPLANQDDIQKAYRFLAKQYHPDVNQSENATAIMQKINEAYQVLSNPKTRQLYDMQHKAYIYKQLEILRLLRYKKTHSNSNHQKTYSKTYRCDFYVKTKKR